MNTQKTSHGSSRDTSYGVCSEHLKCYTVILMDRYTVEAICVTLTENLLVEKKC